mmetsp:Transcript_19035/g.23355  ORF Transcript_19035/g.23355 Transcript_19035/m.23355 type:complete len:238 (-) Transcript_19035:493-1206(-)
MSLQVIEEEEAKDCNGVSLLSEPGEMHYNSENGFITRKPKPPSNNKAEKSKYGPLSSRLVPHKDTKVDVQRVYEENGQRDAQSKQEAIRASERLKIEIKKEHNNFSNYFMQKTNAIQSAQRRKQARLRLSLTATKRQDIVREHYLSRLERSKETKRKLEDIVTSTRKKAAEDRSLHNAQVKAAQNKHHNKMAITRVKQSHEMATRAIMKAIGKAQQVWEGQTNTISTAAPGTGKSLA